MTIDPIQGMNVAQVGEKLFADLSSMACTYASMYTMTIDERVQVHFVER